MHNQLMIMACNFHNTNISGEVTSFDASDFFELNEWFEDDIPALSSFSASYNEPHRVNCVPNEVFASARRIDNGSNGHGAVINNDGSSGREKKEIRGKVAFKTKSEIEVLDDGFKWRKYGKKKVKNSPNPRNYYKCSVEGCPVKKRVERDREDRRYVVTTYEGIHNHEGPGI